MGVGFHFPFLDCDIKLCFGLGRRYTAGKESLGDAFRDTVGHWEITLRR